MLTGFRQWQVRKACMLSGEAPRCFTMPRQLDNGMFVFHRNTPGFPKQHLLITRDSARVIFGQPHPC